MSWKYTVLSNVAEVFNGKTPSKEEQRASGYPVLKIKDVDENGLFKGNFESFVDLELSSKFERKKLKYDDSLILNAAHNSDYVGSKLYRADERVVGALPTGEWLVVRAAKDKLHPRFLNHWLSSGDAKFKIKQLVKGIHLYPKDVARLKIPLPHLEEQKRIAAILDKADAVRRKRRQALSLADDFLRAVFLEMFGDIPAKKSNYEFTGCRGYVSASSGKSSKDVLSDKQTDIPIYGGNGINGYATKYLYSEPVVVIGRVGQQCAITNITSGPTWVTDNAIVVQVIDKSRYNTVYLAYAFMHSPIRNAVTRLDLPFINQPMILDTLIPLPPIDVQNQFEEIRTKVMKLTERLSESNSNFQDCFSALIQKAFQGNL